MPKVTVTIPQEAIDAITASHSLAVGGQLADSGLTDIEFVEAIFEEYAANSLRAQVQNDKGTAAANKAEEDAVGESRKKRAEKAAKVVADREKAEEAARKAADAEAAKSAESEPKTK